MDDINFWKLLKCIDIKDKNGKVKYYYPDDTTLKKFEIRLRTLTYTRKK